MQRRTRARYSNSTSREPTNTKIPHCVNGRAAASGPVVVEPSSTHLVSNYQTAASREFAKRGSAHRDASGKLLDAKRRTDNSLPIDTNHKIMDPSNATDKLSYLTPDPGFTLTEQLKFALAYQDTPARFDLISEYLPGRSREQAIAHYYTFKHDSRFKNESCRARYDRLPAPTIDGMIIYPSNKELALYEPDIRLDGRPKPQDLTGPGTEESYHDNGRLKRRNRNPRVPSYAYGPSEDELLELVPIEIHIAGLKQQLGMTEAKVFEKKKPSGVRRMNRVVVPSLLHLNLVSDNFRHPFHLTDNELMHWLRSEKVLPLVKEWFDTIVYNEDLHNKLLLLLEETGHPYEDQIGDIAHLALQYKLWTPTTDLKIAHQEVLVKSAQFAYRVGVANREHFSNLCRPYSYSEQDSCLDGAMVLLRAFEDFVQNPVDGFFAMLLSSELAGMVKPAVRGHWERIYAFEGEETTADMALSDLDDEQEVTLTTHWDAIMAYEGVDGMRKDFEEAEVIKPVKMTRVDSGLGEV